MIWALLALTAAAVVGFGIALAVRGKREYDQQHQIVPGVASAAPASWGGSHSREATLHRRLGDAVRAARANPGFAEHGLTAHVAAIETEALAIDERLVAAAALTDRHRDEALDRLESHVVELEDTVAELTNGISVAASKELLEHTVTAADLRLRALAEARAEVERIDREVAGTLPTDLPAGSPPDGEAAEPGPTRQAPADPDQEPGTATGQAGA